jgi:hypothetical protein
LISSKPQSGAFYSYDIITDDIFGREIQNLLNEKPTPGMYEISFDSSNHPSVPYFYKLTTGDFSETKKVLLMK